MPQTFKSSQRAFFPIFFFSCFSLLLLSFPPYSVIFIFPPIPRSFLMCNISRKSGNEKMMKRRVCSRMVGEDEGIMGKYIVCGIAHSGWGGKMNVCWSVSTEKKKSRCFVANMTVVQQNVCDLNINLKSILQITNVVVDWSAFSKMQPWLVTGILKGQAGVEPSPHKWLLFQ